MNQYSEIYINKFDEWCGHNEHILEEFPFEAIEIGRAIANRQTYVSYNKRARIEEFLDYIEGHDIEVKRGRMDSGTIVFHYETREHK